MSWSSENDTDHDDDYKFSKYMSGSSKSGKESANVGNSLACDPVNNSMSTELLRGKTSKGNGDASSTSGLNLFQSFLGAGSGSIAVTASSSSTSPNLKDISPGPGPDKGSNSLVHQFMNKYKYTANNSSSSDSDSDIGLPPSTPALSRSRERRTEDETTGIVNNFMPTASIATRQNSSDHNTSIDNKFNQRNEKSSGNEVQKKTYKRKREAMSSFSKFPSKGKVPTSPSGSLHSYVSDVSKDRGNFHCSLFIQEQYQNEQGQSSIQMKSPDRNSGKRGIVTSCASKARSAKVANLETSKSKRGTYGYEYRADKVDSLQVELEERPFLLDPVFLSEKVEYVLDSGLDYDRPTFKSKTSKALIVDNLVDLMKDFRAERAKHRNQVPSLKYIAVNSLIDGNSTEAKYQLLCDIRQHADGSLLEYVKTSLSNVRPKVVINSCINRYLSQYHREGVQFLYDTYKWSIKPWSGCVLADEMGLGKTIQIIAFLAAIMVKTGTEMDLDELKLRRRESRTRCTKYAKSGGNVTSTRTKSPIALIVCPSSLLSNWRKEIDKWGYFSVAELKSNRSLDSAMDQMKRGCADIVLVSYSKLSDFCMSGGMPLAQFHFDVAIFDEIHGLKNPKSVRTRAAHAVKSRCKIGLTGTPVQNNLRELWSVVDVISPNLFYSLQTFSKTIIAPIDKGTKVSANQTELARSRKALSKLHKWLELVMLRRDKSLIADKLKGKRDLIVLCPLSATQEKAYLKFLNSPDVCYIRDLAGRNQGGELNVEGEAIVSTDLSECLHLPLWRMQHEEINEFITKAGGEGTRRNALLQELLEGEAIENVTACDELISDDKDRPGGGNTSTSTKAAETSDERIVEINDDNGIGSEDEGVNIEHHSKRYRYCKMCGVNPTCTFMPCLTILRHIANHLELVRVEKSLTRVEGRRKKEKIAKLILENNDSIGIYRSMKFKHLSDAEQCGKLSVLRELLIRWYKEKSKVLIFSNSLILLNVLDNYLRLLGKRFLRLDGSTPRELRQELCEKFNEDSHIFCMLISTMAGGTGLNLTGASKVVIFDPNWNPAHDLQAQDRAYRIGQCENVQVYRLISQGTVEERMLVAQVHKQKLASMTLDAENYQRRLFDEREVKGVLSKLEYSRDSFAEKAKVKGRRSSSASKFKSVNSGKSTKSCSNKSSSSSHIRETQTFKILNEDCEVFEVCGIKDTVQWNEVVSHDEDAKRDELAAVEAVLKSEQDVTDQDAMQQTLSRFARHLD